jgi:hypothetical protein
MQIGTSFREPARVVMHLNGGFTKVVLERTMGSGMADGGICWDIPTDRIPLHLRAIGSRFLVVTHVIRPDADDTVDALRAAVHELAIEELPG